MAEAQEETCHGCGAEAPQRAEIVDGKAVITKRFDIYMVGDETGTGHVTMVQDKEAPGPESFRLHPVCNACHVDPAHRTLNKLKGHFFPEAQAALALLAAQQQTMLSRHTTPEQHQKQLAFLREKRSKAGEANG